MHLGCVVAVCEMCGVEPAGVSGVAVDLRRDGGDYSAVRIYRNDGVDRDGRPINERQTDRIPLERDRGWADRLARVLVADGFDKYSLVSLFVARDGRCGIHLSETLGVSPRMVELFECGVRGIFLDPAPQPVDSRAADGTPTTGSAG